MNDERFNLEECFVAFIDILGATEAIKNDAQASLDIVHKVYSEAIELFNKTFVQNKYSPVVKIFSDNIVIAIRRETEAFDPVLFERLVEICVCIQSRFLFNGWPTRGGLSCGSFFADSLMVWGSGLVRSYQLESSVAIYPRIVIDPQLLSKLKLPILDKVSLRRDHDGMHYIDYIRLQENHSDYTTIFLRSLVQNNINQYGNNLKACQKWLWLADYLESKITKEVKPTTN